MRQAAVGVLAVGSVVMLLTFVVGGAAAERVFVAVGLLFPGALIALAERQRGPRFRVLLPCGLTLLLLASAAAVVLRAGGVATPALVMLLGLGVVPLVLVPLLHAATFRLPDAAAPRAEPARVPNGSDRTRFP